MAKPLPREFETFRRMWAPGMPSNKVGKRRPLMALIRDLTNDGELVVEFCIRVLLGQDLRLAQDWLPLLRAGRGRLRRAKNSVFDTNGRNRTSAAARKRLTAIRQALATLPEPPPISMEDRRWAAQTLLAYGWGLPGRMLEDLGDESSVGPNKTPTALALKAAEIMEEFQPRSVEEAERLKRILAVLEEPQPQTLVRAPDGTFTASS